MFEISPTTPRKQEVISTNSFKQNIQNKESISFGPL